MVSFIIHTEHPIVHKSAIRLFVRTAASQAGDQSVSCSVLQSASQKLVNQPVCQSVSQSVMQQTDNQFVRLSLLPSSFPSIHTLHLVCPFVSQSVSQPDKEASLLSIHPVSQSVSHSVSRSVGSINQSIKHSFVRSFIHSSVRPSIYPTGCQFFFFFGASLLSVHPSSRSVNQSSVRSFLHSSVRPSIYPTVCQFGFFFCCCCFFFVLLIHSFVHLLVFSFVSHQLVCRVIWSVRHWQSVRSILLNILLELHETKK